MSAQESSLSRMVVTLVVVTGVAAVALGFVHDWTKGPIEEARLQKQRSAISKVAGSYDNDPIAESYEMYRPRGKGHQFRKRRHHGRRHESKTEEVLMFYPAKSQQELKVTAIQSKSENGYNGRIELIVGIDQAGVIRNIEVLSHKETPGLGSKIRDTDFIDQFIGKSPETFNLKVKKDNGDVDAISGATISSRAFSEAVQLAYDAFKHQEDEQGTEQ